MPHAIIYNAEAHIIEIKVKGDLALNEVKEIISEGMKVAIEKNCFLLLMDSREATLKLSTLEIYELPKIIPGILASSGLNIYKLKRAFVATKDLKAYGFFETVSFNRSQRAKIFEDIDKAKKWLFE